jgi:Concanavalin A-like lectin/glucanases superfamily
MSRAMNYLRPLVLLAVLSLAACGGGADTKENPVISQAPVPDYTGPAATTPDIQAFKINLWENLKATNRCGGCHNATGQSPRFARNDDVNLAYQDALALVNLTQPDLSRFVTKVGGGHNCWLAVNSACADTMTVWIRNWAGAVATGGKTIQLVAPPQHDVGSSKTFPADSALYASTIHPLVKQYCSRCHASSASTPVSPYFADASADAAYGAARSKINLDNTSLSRLVVRLRDEFHNCWNDCASNANTMLTQINAFAGGIPLTQVDPTLVTSKALSLYEGTIAAGGNRYESNVIALWEFKTGMGLTAFDTSGQEPAINLNFSGDVSWVGGWGVKVGAGGKAQGTSSASKKLADRIKATGEYSIEAWVAPANVVQEDAWVVSYSGGPTARNATLGQHGYQYQLQTRSSKTDANGAPLTLTAAADRDAQASLQHVVLTYDPVNGQRLYVNGVATGDVDRAGGGNLSDWDDSFALVLGNETSSTRPWVGVLKLVAVHSRALTAAQVRQNFDAGVGERYFMLFNVTQLTNVPQSYLMFEVSQLDSYGYLFAKPTFISLDSAARPGSLPLSGLRIGINGAEARVGQAYVPMDVTINDSNYSPTMGQPLGGVGTAIALEKGPDNDQFFLTFERIAANTHTVTEPAPPSPAPPVDLPPQSDIGLRQFEEISASMSAMTTVPTTQTEVKTTYELVKQALPQNESIEGFLSAQQVGVAQLSIEYCNALIEDSTLRSAYFPGVDFSGSPGTVFGSAAARDQVFNPLMDRMLGLSVGTQPSRAAVRAELDTLTTKLSSCGGSCAADRSKTIAKANCGAVLGSAVTLLQ